jgi:ABC-2 type transport system ATP-binding protein
MGKGWMTESALEIEGLSYGYGRGFALEDISFRIGAGQFTALLGPNGAGKTTLFSLITRLFEAPSGTIRVCGINLRDHPTRALARMGVVFQQPTLDLDLTVRQNLHYFASLHGIGRRDAANRIDEALDRLDMGERDGERVRQLNGGHRRRVELARALLHRPDLLVLDEPTVGLDVPARRGIVEHVHELCRTQGMAVLWATHLIDEVHADDRVVVIHKGRILADGSVAEVNQHNSSANLTQTFHRLINQVAA